MLDGSGLLVGRDWTIVTRDLRTSYFNLFTEPRMFENIGLESGWGCKRMHAIGSSSRSEQQLKRMQSGSSSQSGRDQDQQLKRTQSRRSRRKRGAAAEADVIGGASGRNRGAAALHRELSGAGLLTVGERGGSS